MPKIKEVTTIVEDEVTFMVDPQVEFVSLVKYGANRAPFKVLKSENKEEQHMNKVVQSVLVRNDLSEDEITKALEGIDRRDKKEYQTFTSYPQVPIAKVTEESLIVQKHEEVDGIFFVLGDLAEGTGPQGTLQVEVNEKEAVDYATMDNLYSELYAMADVVGGAMRQENAEPEFRKTTILTTIDNFRAFAEVVLENLSEKDVKAVDPSNHPDLVVDILHAKQEEETEEDKDKEGGEAGEGEDAGEAAEAGESTDKSTDDSTPIEDFSEVLSQFNDSLNNFGTKLIETITESTKTQTESNAKTIEVMDKVVEKVEELQNTAVAVKTEKEEDDDDSRNDNTHKKVSDTLFKGTFFRGMSDFR